MLRVRDSRSGFGVGSGCLETIYSMCWIIVSMNQVVWTPDAAGFAYTSSKRLVAATCSQILSAFLDRTQIESP